MTDADTLFEAAAAALRRNCVDEARALFGQAGAAGRLDAAVIHCNLVAQADWARGLALLRALAPANPRSRRELEVIEAMDLTPDGGPAQAIAGESIGAAPELTLFRALFTPAECVYVAGAAQPMLVPSVVVDPATGRQQRDPVRTSDGMGFTLPLENPAVQALNRRIAAASGTQVAQGEPLQVLRYRPGEEYKPHFDAIPGFANQRVLTMLVWLNADYDGGETHFLASGRRFRGEVGDALLFRNADAGGRRDDSACHAGLPVTRGEKLIASRWIRARRFESPTAGRDP